MTEDLYVSENLECKLAPRGEYGQDIVVGWVPNLFIGRRLDGAWLAWLRRNHTASEEEAIRFAETVKKYCPNLVGLRLRVPPGYTSPTTQYAFLLEEDTWAQTE